MKKVLFILCGILICTNVLFAQKFENRIPILVNKIYSQELSKILNQSSEKLLSSEVDNNNLYLWISKDDLIEIEFNKISYERLKLAIPITNFSEEDIIEDPVDAVLPQLSTPTYSGDPYVGSEITIYLSGKNASLYSWTSDDGYITLSLPDFNDVNNFGGDSDWDDITKVTSGSTIWTCYGNSTTSSYVIVDGFESGWSILESRQIWAKVTPTQVMDLDIYSKMSIGDLRDPSGSCQGPDQQYWPVNQHYISISYPVSPDLIVEDIWTEPANPVIGENVDLYARIKNIGDGEAEDIKWWYYVDGVRIDDDTHGSLDPGETREECEDNYEFTSSGNHQYKVWVEPVSGETITNNNDREETVNIPPPTIPDMIVVDIWTVPAEPVVGEDVDLYVKIKNEGDGTANNIKWWYYIDDIRIDSDTHGSLDPGETREECEDNYEFTSSGNHQYKVWVEPVSGETVINNNDREETVPVEPPPAPDMIVVDIWTEPAEPIVGDDVDLYTTIKNVGVGVANDIKLWYYIDGVRIDYDTHSSLDPGESREEYEANYQFANAGDHQYRVWVEPVGGEIVTNNNDREETVHADPPPIPDIDIVDIWTEPLTPLEGESCELYVEFKNIGDGTANNITIRYYIDGDEKSTDSHGSLDPNQSQIEHNSYTFEPSGDYQYKVCADQVEGEENIANNCLEETVTVDPNQILTQFDPDNFWGTKTAKYGIPIYINADLNYKQLIGWGNLGGKTVDFYIYNNGTWQPIQDDGISSTSFVTNNNGFADVFFTADDSFNEGDHDIKAIFEGDDEYMPCEDIVGTLKVHKPQWLFMVYLCADNNLEGAGCTDYFNEMYDARDNDEVSIVVLFDRIPGQSGTNPDWTTTKYLRMSEDCVISDDIDEKDMGNPNTIAWFLNQVNSDCQANHKALVFWDHGGGWGDKEYLSNSDDSTKTIDLYEQSRNLVNFPSSYSDDFHNIGGVCVDETSAYHRLSLREIRNVLNDHETFEIVGFDACLMGMTEISYDLRLNSNYIIASEDNEPGDGWEYHGFLKESDLTATTSSQQLINNITNSYPVIPYMSNRTLGAWNLSNGYIEQLNDAIANFSQRLIDLVSYPGIKDQIITCRNNSELFCEYSTNGFYKFVDMNEFVNEISNTINDNELESYALLISDLLNNNNFRVSWKTNYPNSLGGLSIYFPIHPTGYDPSLQEYLTGDLLLFSQNEDQKWVNFLACFYDIEEPICTITNSLNGTIKSGTFEVSATANDPINGVGIGSDILWVEFQYSINHSNWFPLPDPECPDGKDWYGENGWALNFVSIDTPEHGTINDDEVFVRARASDLSGNISDWDECNEPFGIDNEPPTGSLVINNDETSTRELIVELDIEADDNLSGVDKMKLSNDDSSWTNWLDFSTTYTDWDLSSYGGNINFGEKTVYIMFKDEAGNESELYSDDILYEPFLDIYPEEKPLEPQAGSFTFSIETNTSWNIEYSCDWIVEIYPLSGNGDEEEVTVTYSENTSTESRECEIEITGEDITKILTVIQEGTDPFIIINPTYKLVDYPEGSFEVVVQSNIEDWDVSASCDWVEIEPDYGSFNGEFTVNYDENTDPEVRPCTITVSGDGVSVDLTLEQQAAPYIEIDPENVYLDPPAGSFTFEITSNTSWEIEEGSDWILEVDPISGSEDDVITVTYAENTSPDSRECEIEITGEDITKILTVNQEGTDPYIIIDPTYKLVDYLEGSFVVDVQSNIEDWDVSASCGWVEIEPDYGSFNGEFTVYYDENNDPEVRPCTITVSGDGVSEDLTLEQQAAPYIEIDPENVYLDPPAGSFTFEISSNTSWEIEEGSDWILEVDPISGSEDDVITVTYAENTSTDSRECEIEITGGDITKILTVNQEGTVLYIIIDPTNKLVNYLEGSFVVDVQSNIEDWYVSASCDWVEIEPDYGSFNGEFTVNYDENPGPQLRSCIIEVSGEDISETLTLEQEAHPYLTIDPIIKYLDPPAGSFTFTVSSNITWNIEKNCEWILEVDPSSGSGDDEITVTYEENTTPETRYCTITVFGEGLSKELNVEQSSVGCSQSIQIPEGFSFISSYIIHEDPDMETVLQDILNDNLVFVRNSNGQTFRKIGPIWVNGIGDWITTEGYLFKMNIEDQLDFEDGCIDPFTPISLTSGFQFVSFLQDFEIYATDAFASIIGDNLHFARNSNGQTLRKIGPIWVNGIGNCIPGEGYLIKMYADDILIYPVGEKASSINHILTEFYQFNDGNPADPVYTIYVEGLEISDEVAAYDDDKMIGAMKVNSHNALDNELPVFSTITEGRGYKSGNQTKLKVWDNKLNKEVNVNIEYKNPYGTAYTENYYPNTDGEYSIVKLTKIDNNVINNISIFPNPAKDLINIVSDVVINKIELINMSGQTVNTSIENLKKVSFDVNHLVPGIYFIKIYTDNNILVEKITIN